MLNAFYEALLDDRVLLFEADTVHSVSSVGLWSGAHWVREDGKIIMLSNCATLNGNICSSLGRYELIEHSTIIQTEIETLKIRLYQPDELIALLAEAGFQDIRVMKAFDRDAAPNLQDEVIVYECRKKKRIKNDR